MCQSRQTSALKDTTFVLGEVAMYLHNNRWGLEIMIASEEEHRLGAVFWALSTWYQLISMGIGHHLSSCGDWCTNHHHYPNAMSVQPSALLADNHSNDGKRLSAVLGDHRLPMSHRHYTPVTVSSALESSRLQAADGEEVTWWLCCKVKALLNMSTLFDVFASFWFLNQSTLSACLSN